MLLVHLGMSLASGYSGTQFIVLGLIYCERICVGSSWNAYGVGTLSASGYIGTPLVLERFQASGYIGTPLVSERSQRQVICDIWTVTLGHLGNTSGFAFPAFIDYGYIGYIVSMRTKVAESFQLNLDYLLTT